MKKIILLALTALMMVGCEKNKVNPQVGHIRPRNAYITDIDSCEYVLQDSYHGLAITHKGNCRFCKERRQKELEELVTKLKEK